MPARHAEQTNIRTRLAALRVERGIPQRTMARLLGMGLTAYRALERGADDNRRLRHLLNAARVLDVRLIDVAEPEWMQWMPVDGYPGRPDLATIWYTAPSSPPAQPTAFENQ